MKYHIDDDTALRKLLLGELSPEEQQQLEERLFLDSECFQQFQAVEDDLIDEYVCGDLSGDESGKFESFFLAQPGRRESVRIARALQKYISGSASPSAVGADFEPTPPSPWDRFFTWLFRTPSPVLKFSAAMVALLFIAGGVWLLMRAVMPVHQPAPPLAHREEGQPSPSSQIAQHDASQSAGQQNQGVPKQDHETSGDMSQREVAAVRDRQEGRSHTRLSPAPVYVLTLLPSSTVRGEGEEGTSNEVQLPPKAGVLDLRIPLLGVSVHPRYRATLQTEDGRDIKTWPPLKSTGAGSRKVVSAKISTKLLRQSTYRLILSGVSSSGTPRVINIYRFQVVRQSPRGNKPFRR
jgi:hypothetical protein